MSRWSRWLVPPGRDVLALLGEQARVSVSTLDAFAAWSATGDPAAAASVRSGEHAADGARRRVVERLTDALTSPIEQEDLYALSKRIDEVVNAAKNTIREADSLAWAPDLHAEEMGRQAVEAAVHLAQGVDALGADAARAASAADAAVRCARRIEHAYRTALAGLPHTETVAWGVVASLELYRCYLSVAEAVVAASDRLRYAVLKAR